MRVTTQYMYVLYYPEACMACYRRTVTSTFVIPFTPLYTPPLPVPTPSATPVPVTRRPPTVTPLANHPSQVNRTTTSLGRIISSSPVNCPLSTYPGLPAPNTPAEALSFGIVHVNDF